MSEKGTVKKKKRWGRVYESESIVRDVVLSEEKAEEVENDIRHSDVVTPHSLAQDHKIRVSLARKILKKFEEDGTITLQYKNGPEEIYSK